jgi:hypothetical protein
LNNKKQQKRKTIMGIRKAKFGFFISRSHFFQSNTIPLPTLRCVKNSTTLASHESSFPVERKAQSAIRIQKFKLIRDNIQSEKKTRFFYFSAS